MDVSDEEILRHLQDVGLSQKEALELLAEAKAEVGFPRKRVEKKEVPVKKAPPAKKEKVKRKPVFIKRVEKPRRPTDLSKLWEKGIIVAVDERLNEMKKIKEDIEAVIDKKIKKAMDKEAKKIEVLFESRKILLINKINAELEKKGEEVKEIIATQLEEIKKLNQATQKDLSKVEAKQVLVKDLYKKVSDSLSETKETRVSLTKEVGASLKEAKEKIAALDERVSRTLELESKITEGMVSEAKSRMEEMIEAKIAGLEEKLTEKIIKAKAPKGKIAPAELEPKVNALIEKRMKEFEKKLEAKLKEIDAKIKDLKEFESSLQKEVSSLISAMEKELKKK